MVKKLILKTICKLMPRKAKKAIFLTNLYLKLSLLEPGDVEELKGLNSELHMVGDLNALKIPLLLYKLIWRDIKLSVRNTDKCRSGFNDNEISHMAKRFILLSERCLGNTINDEGLMEDTCKLIRYVVNKNNGYIPLYCTDCVI